MKRDCDNRLIRDGGHIQSHRTQIFVDVVRDSFRFTYHKLMIFLLIIFTFLSSLF